MHKAINRYKGFVGAVTKKTENRMKLERAKVLNDQIKISSFLVVANTVVLLQLALGEGKVRLVTNLDDKLMEQVDSSV